MTPARCGRKSPRRRKPAFFPATEHSLRLQSIVNGLYADLGNTEADKRQDVERGCVEAEQQPFLQVICDTPARTVAEIQAKVDVLIAQSPDFVRCQSSDRDSEIIDAIFRDIASLGGVA